MIGLDTNVLVRYIMQDDPRQAAKASKLVESLTPARPGFITLVTGFPGLFDRAYCQGGGLRQGHDI